MESKFYKYCIVPHCGSTTIKTPKKLFIYVPKKLQIRKKWLQLARRKPNMSTVSRMYFCEDHFNLPSDMENYIEYHVRGTVKQIRMKPGCMPSKFDCQPGRRKRTTTPRLSPKAVPSKFPWNQQSEVTTIEVEIKGPEEAPQIEEKSKTATTCTNTKKNLCEDSSDSTMQNEGASGSKVPETAAKKYGNCRCCLNFGLHTELRKDHNETLLKLSIFLQDDSRLPDRICLECVSHLEKFSEFRTKVIAVQKKLVGAVVGGVKIEPQIKIETPASEQTTVADPLALTELDIKEEKLDDDEETDTDHNYDQNDDVEDQDKKNIVVEDVALPSAVDDKPQQSPKSSEVSVVRVTTGTQPKVQKIFVPILQKGNLPIISPKGLMPKGLRLITPEMAAKLGLVGGPSSVQGNAPPAPAIQPKGNILQNMIRLPPRMVTKLPPGTQKLQPIAASPANKNVRMFVDPTDPNQVMKLVAKPKPQPSTSKTTGTLTVESIASETDEDSATGELEESLESRKRKSADTTNAEGPSKPKSRKRRVPSETLEIGGTAVKATQKSRLRADIVQTLQNTNMIPFVPFQKQFKCLYCGIKFDDFTTLKNHVLSDHKYINPLRMYNSMQTCIFMRNNMLHTDISDLKCKICNENIEDLNLLFQHLKRKHFKLYFDFYGDDYKGPPHGILGFRLEKQPLQCIVCSKEFKAFRPLNTHMAEHYDFFSCQYCGKKIISYRTHKIHILQHNKPMDSDKSRRTCKFCGKTFKYTYERTTHCFETVKDSNGVSQKLLKCCYCPETFPLKEYVKIEHMKKAHGYIRGEYKCGFCGKVYEIERSLKNHIENNHTQNREKCLVCDKCGYITRDKRHMITHLESHEGIRKFKCEICHKMFRTKSTLRLHMMGHYNQKRFKCRLCEAAFIQKHCLKSHIKSRHPDSGVDVDALIQKLW